MLADLLLFIVSMVICAVILYIVASLWFSGAHTKQLKSFVGFGIVSFLWTLFSAMALLVDNRYFDFVYSLHWITSCAFPYVFFWFALNAADLKLANSKHMARTLIAITALECVGFATNPWHHLLVASYRPDQVAGPLFGVHAILSYIFAFGGLIVIFTHVIRASRRTPMLVLAGVSSLVPYILNIMLALGVIDNRRDLTPIGFFLTFSLFFMASYRSGIFNLKTMALKSIFASFSDVVLIVDAQGIIMDVNLTFSKNFPNFSFDLGETSISSFANWLSGHTKESQPAGVIKQLDDLSASYAGGEFSMVDESASPEDAEALRTFTLRREPIYQKNIVTGYVFTMSDISTYRAMISAINTQKEHLLELKELAETASKSKSIFLANMSHEIRTPINAITGMVAIARNTDDRGKVKDCLDKVDAASRQLLGIINDILDLSKIEADKMELAAEPFELHASLYNIRSIMNIRAAEKRQDLVIDIAEDVPRVVVGDDMRLSQIFLNLISNAIKFSPDDGKIVVSLRCLSTEGDQHYLEAKVTDNGIGISREQLSRLFSSFEQADRGTAKRYGGSGLGLVISKRIATLMGGDITVESEPGKGSCFTVLFQMKAGNADMMMKPIEAGSFDFTGVNILLVEDIAINREIIITLLEDYGVSFDSAQNGQEALDMYQAMPDKYNIIFMDVHMPVMDGYAATKAIRASDCTNAGTIPILAMTANAFLEDVARCRESGMNDHIAKPVDIRLLLEKMARLLGQA